MDEVNIQIIDRGDELRQGVEPGLRLSPIVVGAPVTDQILERCELNPLRIVIDGLSAWPSRSVDALAQIDQTVLRNVDAEGSDFSALAGVSEIRRQQSHSAGDCDRLRSGNQKAPPTLIDSLVFVRNEHPALPCSRKRVRMRRTIHLVARRQWRGGRQIARYVMLNAVSGCLVRVCGASKCKSSQGNRLIFQVFRVPSVRYNPGTAPRLGVDLDERM